MLKYLACLIGLFAIIAVAPARGQAPPKQAPAQKEQPESQEHNQHPDGKPAITSVPVAQTVNVGEKATFTVVADRADSYQWSKNGNPIPGATSASYTTTATEAPDNGAVFSVVVGNSSGNVTQANPPLTVKLPAPPPRPVITSEPVAQSVNVGQTATFTVAATGAASYQWRKNGDGIASATSASYTTPATVAADNGAVFSVVISNSSSSVTSANVTLTVIVPAFRGVPPPLNKWVAITLFIVVLLGLMGALIIWAWQRDPSKSKATDDKDLEALRITCGFWLVIGALLVTLLVLVVTLTALAPETPKTTDIVAIIGAVTGVIGTLTAAFFGIQAAGAGRSQAMTTLSEQLKAQGPDGSAAAKLEPSYGPHDGGTRVSISGNGFTGASAVNFGETQGAHFESVNDGLVRANSPAATQGVDDTKVSVIFPGTAPPNRVVGTFYYYTIAASSADGNTTVTIRGSGLKGANAVKFGTIPGIELKFGTIDGTTFKESPDGLSLSVVVPPLSVDVPAGKAGTDVDVTVLWPVDAPTNSFVVGKYHYDLYTIDPSHGPAGER